MARVSLEVLRLLYRALRKASCDEGALQAHLAISPTFLDVA
jgi:hypothetical protein